MCNKPSHKLSTLPTLLVVGIVKKKKLLFQIVTWLQIGQVIKYSCGFKGGSLWRYIRIGVHESSASEDKIYLICDVTSQDKPINGSCNLMVGSTSWYIHPDKFCDSRHCDSRNIMFLIYHVTSSEHMLKGYVDLWVEVTHGKSPPCRVWWFLICKCKWRYVIFNLSRDLIKLLDWRIRKFYEW